MIKLTEKQELGIKIAKQRYLAREAYTCIAGYAGTGKSTLVKFLLSALDIEERFIAYATFTGKASLVLQQKGHSGAMTLHKLLYKSFKNRDGSFSHIPKDELDYPYKVIVVDEVSMVPMKIWKLLLTHGVHVIALGDPFQLPPIGEDNEILKSPHVFLDEVMRQALESDIIKLSMAIRNGQQLTPLNGNDVKVISPSQLVDGMYLWADQILCGKNATRRMINAQMRNLLGHGEEPQVGDKVICLKNYWDVETTQNDPLINGMIGTIEDVQLGQDEGVLGRKMKMTFSPDFNDSEVELQKVDYKLIKEGNPTHQKEPYQPGRWRGKNPTEKLFEFDYGYAITVHKSQGSQFGKVLLFEEKMNREMHARWLYTAITRAVDKIVIVAANEFPGHMHDIDYIRKERDKNENMG